MRLTIPVVAVLVLAACGDDRPAADDAPSTPVAGVTDSVVSPTPVDLPLDLGPAAESPTPPAPGGTTVTDSTPVASPTDTPSASPPAPPPPPVPPAAGSEGEQIIQRAERAYEDLRSLEADFVQVVEVTLLSTTQRGHGKIYHRSPDRFLMRFTEPAGDIIVSDGRYATAYYPSTDSLMALRSPLSSSGQQVDLQREFLSDATRRFEVTLDGTETVSGRPTHALTLVPLGSSPYRRVRVWVDTGDFLVRRFEITEQNESVRTLEFSNLRPNVQLSDDLFRFEPPPGVQIYEP